jgi:hypothetical protein
MDMPLHMMPRQVEDGTLVATIGRSFHLDDIADASRIQVEKSVGGKTVVLT